MAQEFARHVMFPNVRIATEECRPDYTHLRIGNYEYGFGIHVATIQL